MSLTRATGIYEEMLSRLPSQFRDKPRIAAILFALAEQLAGNEDDLWRVLEGGYIDNATGHDLDVLGQIVGQPRNGQLDDEYRRFIRARIKTNRSDGKIEQLLTIALLVLGGTATVELREYYPSAIEVEIDSVTVDPYILWKDFLHRAKGAAKTLQLIYSESANSASLLFGSFYDGVLPAENDPGSTWVIGTGGGDVAGVFG